MKLEIPPMVKEIKKPKTPIGAAVFVYENGTEKYVPWYYIQKGIRLIIKLVISPFSLLKRMYYKRRYKHLHINDGRATVFGSSGTGMVRSFVKPTCNNTAEDKED